MVQVPVPPVSGIRIVVGVGAGDSCVAGLSSGPGAMVAVCAGVPPPAGLAPGPAATGGAGVGVKTGLGGLGEPGKGIEVGGSG